MYDILLTITQALQLVALAPTVFVVLFLLFTTRRNGRNIVPILYFLSLSCSFLLPLLSMVPHYKEVVELYGTLLMGQSLIVPLSFLLIIQFLTGRIPSLLYWFVLALPLVGGSAFIYAMLYIQEICFDTAYCFPTYTLSSLYSVFGNTLIFLFLIVRLSHSNASIAIEDTDRGHKYWLIISLICLNLGLMLLDLLEISGNIERSDNVFASTIIRISFIYLILTSIFRVFYDVYDIHYAKDKTAEYGNKEKDMEYISRVKYLMEQKYLYRQMGLTRGQLAKELKISETKLSRIINVFYHKNFNELINRYRVKEAKDRLGSEHTPITTIAFEVGFNSIASFNRVFRELVECSPTEYRIQHNRGDEETNAPQ